MSITANPKQVMLMPDILFLVFEHLSLRRLCRYRIVCKEWDRVYRTIKNSTFNWRNTDANTSTNDETTDAATAAATTAAAATALFAKISRVTTLQCDFVQILGDRVAQSKLDLATRAFLEAFSERCRRGKLEGWREWILNDWFNPFVVVAPLAPSLPRTLERLSMTISRPVPIDVLSILFRLPQLVSFELRWSNLGITGMIEWQYVHFPIPTLEAGSALEQPESLEGTYPDVDKLRLERLKINGFRITPMDLYKIAQKAPNLEFIQLIQGLKGVWTNCNLASELGQLCPNLQHVNISGYSDMDTTEVVYRPVMGLMVNLPETVTSIGLLHIEPSNQPPSDDEDSTLNLDTAEALEKHGHHLTSLYISQYYRSDIITHHLFHYLAKMDRLEAFYAPFSSEFDIYSLSPSHPLRLVNSSTPPFIFPKLKALELTWDNSARTLGHFGIHSMAKSINDIIKTIVKAMPNLEHLHLRLSSRLVVDSHVKLRRLGQLQNLKTLVIVARIDDDLWDKKALDWLRKPAISSGSTSFMSSSMGSPSTRGKKFFSSGRSSSPLLSRKSSNDSELSSQGFSSNNSDTSSNNGSSKDKMVASVSTPKNGKHASPCLPHLERFELIRTGNQTPLESTPMDPRSSMWFQAAKDYLAEIRPEVKAVFRHKYSREIGRMIFHSQYDDTYVLRRF
ncbi:hypothetical protein BGW41_004001 [Actinomortierella wolfii]|nr:hypothetical protein BGW41_004001 [Actinomortierella wolfii]